MPLHTKKNPLDILRAPSLPQGAEKAIFDFSGAERPEVKTSAARQIALDKLEELRRTKSLEGPQLLMGLLASEEGQLAFAVDPDFVDAVVQALQTPAEEGVLASPGQVLIGKQTGKEIGRGLPRRSPTGILVDDILAAEAAKDKPQAELLMRGLPRDDASEISIMDAVRLVAGGKDPKTIPHPLVKDMTREQAVAVLRAAQAEGGPSINEMLLTAVDPDAPKKARANAVAALELRKEVMGAENFLAALLGGAREGIGLPGKGGGVLERIKREIGGPPGALPPPQVPTAGQTAAPTQTPALGATPAEPAHTVESIEAMTIEEAQALGEDVMAGKVVLAPELSAVLEGILLQRGPRKPAPTVK